VNPRPTVALAVLAFAAASCSIEAGGSAQRIDDGSVQFDLLDDQAVAVVPEPDGREFAVCLLDDDQLVSAHRRITTDASLLEIAQSLEALTDAEAAAGLHSAITTIDDLQGVRLSAGTATVDFTEDAPLTSTGDPLETIAQLVCTLTAQPGVGLVRFTIDGAPVEVPVADGTLTDAAVSIDDYAPLLAA
jgi:hypothetical protein